MTTPAAPLRDRPELTGVWGLPENALGDALLATLPTNLAEAPWDCVCSAVVWTERGGSAASVVISSGDRRVSAGGVSSGKGAASSGMAGEVSSWGVAPTGGEAGASAACSNASRMKASSCAGSSIMRGRLPSAWQSLLLHSCRVLWIGDGVQRAKTG
mgnify:CR=1 FL=1